MKSFKHFFSNTASISSRLNLFYSVSTFILISIISLFAYFGMVHVLHKADQQFLNDEVNILKNILATKPNNITALNQEVIDIPQTLQGSAYHYYIRILDENNKVVAVTPKINAILQKNKFLDNTLTKHDHYLFLQTNTDVGTKKKLWKIQTALDVSYQDSVINKYGKMSILLLLLGAIFSIFIGSFISRQGMRRLYELTATTKKITARALHQRLEPQFWPKELNELAKAYNQMLERIENSVARLTAFSDDLAHELRTPIANLMFSSELVISQENLPNNCKLALESNLEELNRLSQIIENILFLAQAENPHLEIQKKPMNISKEIKIMCSFYQALADEKNINLFCEGEATANVNSTMFRRMIGNLLSNALKFSHPGGEVTFKIEGIVNNMIKITLSDSGMGIKEENLPKIFDRFYRTDAARSNAIPGNGLGLAIAKSILDMHNGTILVNSTVNIGTTIIINLPK